MTPGNKFIVTPVKEMNKEELNACLKSFYTSARKQDGQFYKSSSWKANRAAIDRCDVMRSHMTLEPCANRVELKHGVVVLMTETVRRLYLRPQIP